MRLSPSSNAQPTPAQRYIEQAQWLLDSRGVVVGLEAVGASSVRVVVADPFVRDSEDRRYADRLAADSAMAVLEQAAHGVRLIPTTRDGYVGTVRDLAPAQLTFITGLPGVQRSDLVPSDTNGDGFVGPEEAAYLVEVDRDIDAARVDWLLRNRLDDGMVQEGPVQVTVPTHPWRPAPITAP